MKSTTNCVESVTEDLRATISALQAELTDCETLRDPAGLYDRIGALVEQLHHFETVIRLTAAQVDHLTVSDGVGVDDLGDPVDARMLAATAFLALHNTCRAFIEADEELRTAHTRLSRLYLDPDGERNHP